LGKKFFLTVCARYGLSKIQNCSSLSSISSRENFSSGKTPQNFFHKEEKMGDNNDRLSWVLGGCLVLLVVVAGLAICAGLGYYFVQDRQSAQLQQTSELATPQSVAIVQPTPASAQPFSPPGQPSVQPVQSAQVVQPTPGLDFGQPLKKQPVTPVVGNRIDWPHGTAMPNWISAVGLTGARVFYAQTSKQGKFDAIPTLPDQTVFTVPPGAVLIVGGFTVNTTLGSGKSYAVSNGFYGALSEGTVVTTATIVDGFVLLIENANARKEYCARVTQAFNERWAPFNERPVKPGHLFRLSAWDEPVCSGSITTPIGDTLR